MPFEIARGVIIPVGEYEYYLNFTRIDTSDSRPIKLLLRSRVGEFFDGEQIDISVKIEWRPNPHFFASILHRNINVNLPQGDFDIEIDRLKLDTLFNPKLSWSNFLQHESETHLITLNSQLRWIVTPGTELTLTLNHDLRREDRAYKSDELDFSTLFYWTQRY